MNNYNMIKHTQAESIDSVAGENSVATQEILAATEEKKTNIESIHNLMANIKKSSEKLQEFIGKR